MARSSLRRPVIPWTRRRLRNDILASLGGGESRGLHIPSQKCGWDPPPFTVLSTQGLLLFYFTHDVLRLCHWQLGVPFTHRRRCAAFRFLSLHCFRGPLWAHHSSYSLEDHHSSNSHICARRCYWIRLRTVSFPSRGSTEARPPTYNFPTAEFFLSSARTRPATRARARARS